jgi:hypothetical protein
MEESLPLLQHPEQPGTGNLVNTVSASSLTKRVALSSSRKMVAILLCRQLH